MQTLDQYVGIFDPGDEDTYRHASWPKTDQSRKASVYRFGARWHWKCGPADKPGDCLGGPALTQEAAQRAADEHIRSEHIREIRIHDDASCWCGEGR